jgi:hypothetical protein
MSNQGDTDNEHAVQRNLREHRNEIREALARDSELNAEPELAMSLEQLDLKIAGRLKFRRNRKGRPR